MKNPIVLLSAAIFAFSSLTSCTTKKQKEQANQDIATAQIDSLKQALMQSESETNDLMETVEQIQTGFRNINEAEGIINVQVEKGDKANKKTILENMALIEKKMQLNRELIANLQEQLRSSKNSNNKMRSALEDMVKDFQNQLTDKNEQIANLKKEIEEKSLKIQEQAQEISNLNTNVNDLTQNNEAQAKSLAEQDKALHTVYYVFGTKRELKEQKILRHDDVLKSNDFNRDYFAKADYRVQKVIPLYSKSAQIMTNHPAGSYRLDRDANKQYTLRITDPEKFWSVSKYLVIVVK